MEQNEGEVIFVNYSFGLLKPDCLKRGLEEEVFKMIESTWEETTLFFEVSFHQIQKRRSEKLSAPSYSEETKRAKNTSLKAQAWGFMWRRNLRKYTTAKFGLKAPAKARGVLSISNCQ